MLMRRLLDPMQNLEDCSAVLPPFDKWGRPRSHNMYGVKPNSICSNSLHSSDDSDSGTSDSLGSDSEMAESGSSDEGTNDSIATSIKLETAAYTSLHVSPTEH